jgi:hypothetical protein
MKALSHTDGNKALSKFKLAWGLLQIGDLLSTLYVFTSVDEANPLVARLLPLTGPVGGICAMKAIGCAIVIPIQSKGILRNGPCNGVGGSGLKLADHWIWRVIRTLAGFGHRSVYCGDLMHARVYIRSPQEVRLSIVMPIHLASGATGSERR